MDWLIIILPLWIGCCIGTGVLAKTRGHKPVGFAFLAFVISPLFACIILLVMPSNVRELERMSVAAGSSRKCPFCAETVKAEAIVCRFCGRDIPPNTRFTREQIRQDTLAMIRDLEKDKRIAWVPDFLALLRELHLMSQSPSIDRQQCAELESRIDCYLEQHQLRSLRRVLDWAQALGDICDEPHAA